MNSNDGPEESPEFGAIHITEYKTRASPVNNQQPSTPSDRFRLVRTPAFITTAAVEPWTRVAERQQRRLLTARRQWM